MPETAKQLTDQLLRRVRDVSSTAHSRELAREILSKSQQILNTFLGLVTVTPTLTTQPYQQFYTINGLLTGADALTKLVAIREGARDLAPLPNWRHLSHLSLRWHRQLSERHEAWTQMGRDLLIIYPAKNYTSSVTIIGTKLTTDLTAETTELEFPNEYHDHIITLAEVLLLAKQRDLGQAFRQLSRLIDALPHDRAGTKFHLSGLEMTVGSGEATKEKPR